MRQDSLTEDAIAKFMAVCIAIILIVFAIVFGVCWVSKQKADIAISTSETVQDSDRKTVQVDSDREDVTHTVQGNNTSVHVEVNNGEINVNISK